MLNLFQHLILLVLDLETSLHWNVVPKESHWDSPGLGVTTKMEIEPVPMESERLANAPVISKRIN
jgi:hypothetical protein